MTGHDRRGFLHDLVRRAVQAGAELDAALQPAPEDESPPGAYAGPAVEPSPVLPATPATRTARAEDVRALCAELGRLEWADAAPAAARLSFRLTPGGPGSAIRLGGAPDLPDGFEWPAWQGEELAFLAGVRLNELPASPLPADGCLLVFASPPSPERCRVVHVSGRLAPAPRRAWLPELPVAVSAELTLPPEPLQIELDARALDDWLRLRERLAAAQGVELEESADDYHALHRLLGHPDTVASEMELHAQLLAHGIDPESTAVHLDPRVPGLAAGAREWRLLLQLSEDPALGLELDGRRLYVWIRADDLAAARFEAVRAFVR